MSKKSLIILLVLVVVVGGVVGGILVFLNNPASEQTAQQTEQPSPTPNINLSEANGKTISYIKLEDGETAIEIEMADGVWKMVGSDSAIDQTTAGGIAIYLTYLYAHETIDIKDTPLSAYGLDPGDFVVTYSTGNDVFINYYGKYTSDRDAVYFRKSGDDTVYTVEVEYFDAVKNDLDSLKDRSVDIPRADATGYVAFKQPGEDEIVLQQVTQSDTYTSIPWIMISPVTIPVTDETASLVYSVFGSVSLTDFVDDEVLPEYGIDGQTWFEYRDYSGDVITHINVGALGREGEEEEFDRFYCTVDGKDGVYLLPRAAVDAAASSALSLIDQRLIPLDDFTQLDQMTLTKGEQTAILTLKDGGYTLDGQEVSQEQAMSIYNKMRTVNFVGLIDEEVEPVEYCSIRVARAGFGGKDINIKIFPFLKDFYAVDYGSGPQVYVKAELMDNMLAFFLEFDPQAGE